MANTGGQQRKVGVATLVADKPDCEAVRASREEHIHVSYKDDRIGLSRKHDDNFVYAQ